MPTPRTFQPEQHSQMLDYLAALSPHGVTVTNADGTVTVAEENAERDAAMARGAEINAAFHARKMAR